jgi:hypothetical protein
MSPSQLNYIRVTFPPIIVSPSPTHQAVTALRPKSKRRGFICTATFAASRGAIDRARPPSSATTHDYVVVPSVSAAQMHPVTENRLFAVISPTLTSTSLRACTGMCCEQPNRLARSLYVSDPTRNSLSRFLPFCIICSRVRRSNEATHPSSPAQVSSAAFIVRGALHFFSPAFSRAFSVTSRTPFQSIVSRVVS